MNQGESIRCGKAIVPWGKSIIRNEHRAGKNAGWVLPGGERTTDSEIAQRVCVGINALMLGR